MIIKQKHTQNIRHLSCFIYLHDYSILQPKRNQVLSVYFTTLRPCMYSTMAQSYCIKIYRTLHFQYHDLDKVMANY